MSVYDVEILDVNILDAEVKRLLEGAQRAAIVSDVSRRDEERRLAGERLKAHVDGEIHAAQMTTVASASQLEAANAERARANLVATLDQKRLDHEARAAQAERDAEIARRAQDAHVAAFERQMAALAPELIATLRTLGHQQLASELSRNVGPLAMLGGEDVTEIVGKLLGSLPIGARSTVAEVVKHVPKAR